MKTGEKKKEVIALLGKNRLKDGEENGGMIENLSGDWDQGEILF